MSLSPPEQPVAGFRSWRVIHRIPLKLKSLWIDQEWHPGIQFATCRPNPVDSRHPCENPPTENCHCGYYGNYWMAPYGPKRTLIGWGIVDGLVAGFGSMWFHADGWRAEKTVLLALLDAPGPTTKILSEEYDVPLAHDFNGLLQVAYEHDLRILTGWTHRDLRDRANSQ